MAQNFTSADAADYDAIKVSDIDPPSLTTADQEIADFIRSHGTSTLKERRPRPANKRERVLRALDQHYGPLVLGQFTVSRVELHLMNAQVYGKLLDIDNTNFRCPSQAFIDGLHLNPVDVESRIRSSGNVGDYTIPTLLFEIATHRSIDAGPLLAQAQDSHVQKIDRLLQAAQKLDIRDTRLPERVPDWVNKQKSKVANSMGVGLQAFGIYSGLMGITDAMKRQDHTEALISAGAVVTELGSLIIERGLVKTAEELIENSARIYQGFSRTHFGLHLSRAAGLIAGVLTLPFDIYFAIKALNDAANTTGKQALDHYVAAGMNLASAALTLILGTAALAGFASAGPLGIAAAVFLIAGAQIYSAIRQIDDITDHIELSFGESVFAFRRAINSQEPWQSIHDRYTIALAKDQHAKMFIRRAQKWLDGQLKDNVCAIVNGNIDVSLKASQVFWFEWDDQGRESIGSKDIKVPVVDGGDDAIDARKGIPVGLSGVVNGTDGKSKATLWLLGGGNDIVLGIEKKPNHFSYGTGSKYLTGGEMDDQFLFEGAVQTLKSRASSQAQSHLAGGGGNDTLVLLGQLDSRDQHAYTGFLIDLESGHMRLEGESTLEPSSPHTTLESIEHVETLAGAKNLVIGSSSDNRIVSKGNDQIFGGDGDDAIYMMGNHGSAEGQAGKDQYYIAHKSGTVIITEQAGEESLIIMDWALEAIQQWSIEETSLVVSSLCGIDGEWPERKLIIKDIYKSVGDKRLLQEQKLRFLTKDGFQLSPDFPDELEGLDKKNVDVLILSKGKRPAPMIINHLAHGMSGDKSLHYFVDRDITRTAFNISNQFLNVTSSIHIDCDSTEISAVQANYTVEVSAQHGNTYLNYRDFDLHLSFNNKTLKIQDLIANQSDTFTNIINSSYMVKGLMMKRALILTLRDGVSYRITPPLPNYVDDATKPGLKQLDGWQMLKKRAGRYLLNSPQDNSPILLPPRPQRIDFPNHLQTAVDSLEGSGSIYHVHFLADTTLRISTPGAFEKTSNASTWYIHSRDDHSGNIKFSGNKLLVGRCIVHLPEYSDNETPVEQIYVITPSGVTHAVDLIFEQVYIPAL
jgi:hypothetical protein